MAYMAPYGPKLNPIGCRKVCLRALEEAQRGHVDIFGFAVLLSRKVKTADYLNGFARCQECDQGIKVLDPRQGSRPVFCPCCNGRLSYRPVDAKAARNLAEARIEQKARQQLRPPPFLALPPSSPPPV